MSDLEFLYAVMAAFYLWECTHWLGLNCVPFVAWFAKPFHPAKPFFIANSREAGLVFASPVPFFGAFLVAGEWPAAIAPSGIATEDGGSLLFENKLQFTIRRQQIRVNGQRFATASSASQARRLVAEWRRVATTPEADRASMIKQWIRDSLHCDALVARLKEFKQAAWFSSMMAGVLFVFVLVVSPILIWKLGLPRLWPWLLSELGILCLFNAIIFLRAHRQLHPALDDERFAHFLMALLFPPAGMRVQDMLSRPLLESFHPLAVAKVTCGPEEFRRMAGRVVRELNHPRKPRVAQPDAGEPVQQWFNQAMLAEMTVFISRSGLDMDSLLQPPERSDPESRSYCPRCQAQFTRDDGDCSDCGVALVEFGQTEHPTAS